MNAGPDTLVPAWLTIDLAAVGANYDAFRALAAPGCAVAAVVKADAYGLGADRIVPVLGSRGCPYYFVATPEEALAVRALTPKPVAVLGGLWNGAAEIYIRHNITPVLNSLSEIAAWKKETERTGKALPAVLQFDTGMNRLGLRADETAILLAEPDRYAGLNLQAVMSHFACADIPDHPMTAAQHKTFSGIAAHFPGVPASLCNSSGAVRLLAAHGGMIRPGMGLYGLNPAPERLNTLRPVVSLSVRILQIRHVKKGETAGYGATHRFEKDTLTATVAAGYADGVLRSLSNRGALYKDGVRCPVAGRVSMDLVAVDVGTLSPPPQPGDTLDILGPDQDADALAADAGTIGYEILTALGRRYRRLYKPLSQRESPS